VELAPKGFLPVLIYWPRVVVWSCRPYTASKPNPSSKNGYLRACMNNDGHQRLDRVQRQEPLRLSRYL
jgi:hypothetical protein